MPETIDLLSKKLDDHLQIIREQDKTLVAVASDLKNLIQELRQAKEDNLRKFDSIERNIEKIGTVLNGNGLPGVISNVATLQQRVGIAEKANKETKDLFWKIATFGFALVTIVINFFPKISL